MITKVRQSSQLSTDADYVRCSDRRSLASCMPALAFVLGSVSLAPLSLSAHGGGGQANATESPVMEISMTQRAEIRAFLVSRFDARAIGKDLRAIIFRRIDLVTAGSKEEGELPKLTSYPSVAQQIAWQYSLRDIAAEFRKAYPSRFNSHSIALAPDGDRPPASAEYLFWSVPNIVENAQGAFSLTFMKRPFPLYLATSPSPHGKQKIGIGWIRPALTGSKALDERVAKSLIDTGVSSATQSNDFAPNFFVSDSGEVHSILERVWVCALREDCASILRATDARSSEAGLKKSRKDLFGRLFLSNPYGGRSSETAVLEIDEANHLVMAIVGPKDLGYASLLTQRPYDERRLGNVARQLAALQFQNHAPELLK